MSLSNTDSDQIPSTSGISDKFQKVQPDASNEIYLAGSSLGSGDPLPLSTPGEETGDCQVGASFEKAEKHDTTSPRESIGVPSICCHHRSDLKSQAQRYGASLVKESEPVTPRPERTYAEVAIQTTPAMVENKEPIKVSSAEASTSYHYHPHGCLLEQIGWPLREQICSREVVAEIPVISYKHPRSTGSISNIKENQPKKGLSHSLDDGQQHSSALYKLLRIQIAAD